ncbi:glycoside hydrolase family 88 protein [Labilibaculum manganireducens]|uniref:glycoside hydrolase family 88/105 protein n=1 Tax=Labilibaculum manganireducens TaxID=1940525 RepID=UPI0029F4B1B8|nr:glycoside hydrolase family 88 protein [Labilibaculum manganireducens]
MKTRIQRSISCLLLLTLTLGATAQTKVDYCQPEYVRSVLNKVAKWQLDNPKRRAPNDWTNAVFLTGLFAAWEVTQSPFMYEAMMENGKSTNWSPYKRFFHADDIAISSTYIDLYLIEKKQEMLQPTIDTLARFVNEPYTVKGIDQIKYWWADALFMAPPVLIKLGRLIDRPDYLEYNDELYRQAYEMLYNKEEHLFARDLNFTIKNDPTDLLEANGKPLFWSRGNGWVIAGLARMLKELPSDYQERPFYENLFREMATRLVEIQREDGLWSSGLLDISAYPNGEVSGSGLICFGLAYGINSGLLKGKNFKRATCRAWKGLTNCVSDEGRANYVQGAGDRPSNRDFSDNTELYGTGAFLLAGSEIIKMK